MTNVEGSGTAEVNKNSVTGKLKNSAIPVVALNESVRTVSAKAPWDSPSLPNEVTLDPVAPL